MVNIKEYPFPDSMTKHVVVIGAGIVGLSTALALLDKGFKVTILAQWQPGDMHIQYTSPWAGNEKQG